jgi:hypothetical protein
MGEGSLTASTRALAGPLVLIAAIALTLAAATSAAAAKPDLVVKKVLTPQPPGVGPGESMFVRLRLVNRASTRAPRALIRLYLSRDRRKDGGDVRLRGRLRTKPLRGGARRLISGRVTTPFDLAGGIYRLLACADDTHRVRERREGNNCKASKRRLAFADGGSPGGVPGGRPPATEFFPTPDQVGARFDCPLSLHGQSGPGVGCVWVDTVERKSGPVLTGLFYCPHDYPYPYEVALGFDPLWLDRTVDGIGFSQTIAGTKYAINGAFPYSWRGNPDGSPGYILFGFRAFKGEASGQARYVCSQKIANTWIHT